MKTGDFNLRICSALGSFFKYKSGREGVLWLNSPLKDFGNMTPKEMIDNGKAENVAKYLEGKLKR